MSCIFNLDWQKEHGWGEGQSFLCADCNWYECEAAGGWWFPFGCEVWNLGLLGNITHIQGCPMGKEWILPISWKGWCCEKYFPTPGDGTLQSLNSCFCSRKEQPYCEQDGGVWIPDKAESVACRCDCICGAMCEGLWKDKPGGGHQEEFANQPNMPADVVKLYNDTFGDERATGGPIGETNGKPDIPDPGVHTCCDQDCLRCLLDAMRNTESSNNCTEGESIVNTCDGPGCSKTLPDGTKVACGDDLVCCAACDCVPDSNGEWTQEQKEKCWSCGPYQIQKDYWDDARQQCLRAPECCELNDIDWNSLCDGTLSCAEQKRLSELAIMCWWRRFTRNGDCQCTGSCTCTNGPNTDCPTDCFSCEDLARIHNGGPCSLNSSGTDGYINDRNKICHWLCQAGGSCPACLGCDCDDDTTIQVQKAIRSNLSFPKDTPPRKTGGKNKLSRRMSPPTKNRNRTTERENQLFWEKFGKNE